MICHLRLLLSGPLGPLGGLREEYSRTATPTLQPDDFDPLMAALREAQFGTGLSDAVVVKHKVCAIESKLKLPQRLKEKASCGTGEYADEGFEFTSESQKACNERDMDGPSFLNTSSTSSTTGLTGTDPSPSGTPFAVKSRARHDIRGLSGSENEGD